MKKLMGFIISMILIIMLIGCSMPISNGEDTQDIPTEFITGTLQEIRQDTRTEINKKGESLDTVYIVFSIEDDFGDVYEINFYDTDNQQANIDNDKLTELVPVDDLVAGSTMTLEYRKETIQSGDTVYENLVGISYSVDYVPLELTTGITSYELMNSTYNWHYQQIHSEITLEGTYQSGGRTMDYSLVDMVTKESDGNVFHSVETVATVIDGQEENRSLVVYVDFPDNTAYYNVNYDQWKLVQLGDPVDTNMDISQDESSYTQTSYLQDANEYIIEGTSNDIEAGYVGQLIKGILSEYAYEPSKLSYTMSSIFDAETNQIILSEYVVKYDGTLFTGEDTLTLDKFEIMINYIDGNNTKSVVLPDYIQKSIDERNRPKYLYEVLFGVPAEELTDDWLELELSEWCKIVTAFDGDVSSFISYFRNIVSNENVNSVIDNLNADATGNVIYDIAVDCVKSYYNDYMLHETGEAVFEISEYNIDETEESESEESEDESSE